MDVSQLALAQEHDTHFTPARSFFAMANTPATS